MPTVRSVKFTANRIPTFIRTSADHAIILVTLDTLSGTQRISDDNADQLIQAPLKNANNNTLITQYTYGYDLAANRTSELIGSTTTTSTPNNVNEITSQSGGTNRTLYYDYNGSLVNDGLTRTFEWDAANRLVAANIGTNRSEFTYDGLNRCVKIVEKTNGSVTSTRKFVWCGNEKCEFRDGSDVVTLFAYPQGQYASNTKYFYFRDHLGSIREMMKTNGTVVARFDYDPWGRSTTVINTTLPDFNYTGLYRHSASNLDFAVYRAYDPDLGRWINRDPIGETGGINLYRYVSNDPVSNSDILGLCCDRDKIAQGRAQLERNYQRALQHAALFFQRTGIAPNSLSCIDSNVCLIFPHLDPIPDCWSCRVEHRYSGKSGSGSWQDHYAVVCRGRDDDGKIVDTMVFDLFYGQPMSKPYDWLTTMYPGGGAVSPQVRDFVLQYGPRNP